MLDTLKNIFKSFWILESFFFFYISKFSSINTIPFSSFPPKKTIFIFGSGSSLNELSTCELNRLKDIGDTMGFNAVVDFEKIHWDYFIIREFEQKVIKLGSLALESIFNWVLIKDFDNKISASHFFSSTKFLICSDRKCGQALLWLHFFGKKFKNKLLYTNKLDRSVNWPPSNSLFEIPHGNATLNDAINLSYLAGYSEIVLVGVDLYDSRYFYLKENETRDFDKTRKRDNKMKHNTSGPMLANLLLWKTFLLDKNVTIKVLNPKSMAASVVDIYSFSN
jgi:hypothetical protein